MAFFTGMAFPFDGTVSGVFGKKQWNDCLITSALQILLTSPGERVMRPTFGSGLNDRIWNQNDELEERELRNEIQNQIRTWDPRIEIVSLSFSRDTQNNRMQIQLSIQYSGDPMKRIIPMEFSLGIL